VPLRRKRIVSGMRCLCPCENAADAGATSSTDDASSVRIFIIIIKADPPAFGDLRATPHATSCQMNQTRSHL
jgi:hypothetical protein